MGLLTRWLRPSFVGRVDSQTPTDAENATSRTPTDAENATSRIDPDAASGGGDKRRRRRRRKGTTAPKVAAQVREAAVVAGPLPLDHDFGKLRVSAPVSRALADCGFSMPTAIQELAIPVMLRGGDLIGQAQTGTGKTAGFGIPIVETVDARETHIQAIVLTPTRELAQQVAGEIGRLAKYRGVRVVALYGGQSINTQFDALARGAHVIVGTPGRVIDHLERHTINFDRVRIAVLDEADMMLDIGFFPDIRRILRRTPGNRQTALFTATVPTPIKNLIHNFLREPEWVKVGLVETPVEEVRQLYCEVAERDKPKGLSEVLKREDFDQALIFRRTQLGVDRLVADMCRRGHAIEGIHGAMNQSKRDAVMRAFRRGDIKILVATNLASRGLDIPAVSNVINYDMPENVEEYIHRIGRTARMGRQGTAVTFVSEWDMDFFDAIVKHVGEGRLEKVELSIYR